MNDYEEIMRQAESASERLTGDKRDYITVVAYLASRVAVREAEIERLKTELSERS